MTKRGSLVYYLTAWVVGCISTVSIIWLFPSHIPGGFIPYRTGVGMGGFLGLSMASLMAGATPALLFGWTLRRVMTKFPAAGALKWILTGSVLSLALVSILGAGEEYIFWSGSRMPSFIRFALMLLFAGPGMVFLSGLASSVPAGGITAFVLSLVHRAFDPGRPAAQ